MNDFAPPSVDKPDVPNAAIEVSYTPTMADHQALRKYSNALAWKPHQKGRIIAILVFLSIYAAFVVFFFWPVIVRFQETHAIDPAEFIDSVKEAVAIPFLVAVVGISSFLYQGYWTRRYYQSRQCWFIASVDGVLSGNSIGFAAARWDIVQRIDEDQSYIYILLTKTASPMLNVADPGNGALLFQIMSTGYALPKRTFADPDAVLAQLHSLKDQATMPEYTAKWESGLSRSFASVMIQPDIDELLALDKYLKKSSFKKGTWTRYLATCTLYYILVFIIQICTFPSPHSGYFLSPFFCTPFLQVITSSQRTKSRLTAIIKNPIQDIPKTISIRRECLTVTNRMTTYAFAWSWIKDVKRDKSGLKIYMSRDFGYALPEHFFDSPTAYDRFVTVVEAARIGDFSELYGEPDPTVWPPAPKVSV